MFGAGLNMWKTPQNIDVCRRGGGSISMKPKKKKSVVN